MSQYRCWIEKNSGRGARWKVRWIDSAGPHVRRKETKEEAEALRTTVRQALRRGRLGLPVDQPWDTFVTDELAAAETSMSRGGRKRMDTAFKAVTRILKPKKVSDIATYTALEKFSRLRAKEPGKRGKTIQADTIVADLQYIRAALVRAEKRQIIAEVPEIPTVSTYEKPPRFLSMDTINALIKHAINDRETALVWLLLTTGRRLEDVLHLEWQNVELDNAVIYIRQSDDYQTKGRREDYAFLDQFGVDVLKRIFEAAPKKISGGKAVPKCSWVFCTKEGTRWTNNVRRSWLALCKRAELPEPYPRIHDLKHTFVSGLIMAGVQQSVITKAAAHKSTATTQKYYSWVVDESRRQAATALPWVKQQQKKDDQAAEGA